MTSTETPAPHAPSLLQNLMSLVGAVVVASSFFAAVCLFAIDFFRGFTNPYMGILSYIVAPGFLAAGFVIMAVGALRERRRRRQAAPEAIPPLPRIDLNVARQRRVFVLGAAGTFVFLLMTALGSYRTYQFTDSVAFCGLVCHTVMKPEYTVYQKSPHARVACAECHIGSGATWFVKSKLSGAYQVYATIANKYPRPIPVPVANLRPARQTCEECHWPRMFYGAAERVQTHYLADEHNKPWKVRMLVHIGGGEPGRQTGGIHWHMLLSNKVEYVAGDRQRQTIPWVRLTDANGKATVYRSADAGASDAPPAGSIRTMDCIDCHNRPTHIYLSPIDAVDRAIAAGSIDRNLPFIKKQAVLALAGEPAMTSAGRDAVAAALTGFYAASYPKLAGTSAVTQAAAAVQDIWDHNIFPAMKADWRAYPDNIGHKESAGCFRCHDGSHTSADGKTITHDCGACHTIIEQGPAGKTTSRLAGLEFKHPADVGDAWKQTNCNSCHDGATLP